MSFRYWSALSADLKGIVKDVEREWNALLKDTTKTELAYQEFLQKNAGLFWADSVGCVLVLSQLRLGADLITDFVLGFDRGSEGFAYELIEIESPHTPPYNADGTPSRRMTVALQQIRDWKQWIDANRNEEARRLFPSKDLIMFGRSVFRYTIIIGNRSDSAAHLGRRNHLAQDAGISIRSFDYLTDRLRQRIYLNVFDNSSPECDHLSEEVRNQLVNPFNKAIPQSVWNSLVKDPRFAPFHMVACNADLLIKNWKQSDLLKRFDSEWASLPHERLRAIEQNWLEEKGHH